MIDLHVHYLPGVDDGPKDLAASLAMARLAVADGITAATATPHHLNGRYTNNAAAVRVAVAALRHMLTEQKISLDLYPGSEVHLTPELPRAVADGTAMTVADHGRVVLVELPVHNLPVGTEIILSECLALGVTPLIAHPERCRPLQNDLAPLHRWVEMGCLVQATAQSCTGRFGRHAKRAVYTMLCDGLVHVLASDGHRPYGRVPCLSTGRAVVAQWIGDAIADHLTHTIPLSLLEGRNPDPQAIKAIAEIKGVRFL